MDGFSSYPDEKEMVNKDLQVIIFVNTLFELGSLRIELWSGDKLCNMMFVN